MYELSDILVPPQISAILTSIFLISKNNLEKKIDASHGKTNFKYTVVITNKNGKLVKDKTKQMSN